MQVERHKAGTESPVKRRKKRRRPELGSHTREHRLLEHFDWRRREAHVLVAAREELTRHVGNPTNVEKRLIERAARLTLYVELMDARALNDSYILANDEGQAADDLSLAKKLIAANPILAAEVTVNAEAIDRVDGKGALRILPARDVAGQHGKTFLFCAFDEIHGYRSHDLFEALAPDPSRPSKAR